MDSYLHLYKKYYAASTLSILRSVYGWKGMDSLKLWASCLALGVCAIGITYFRSGPGAIAVFALLVLLWTTQHHKAVKSTYSRFYNNHEDRLRFFGRNYQYLRYLLFKEQAIQNLTIGQIEDALVNLELELQTDTSTPISSHPFIAGVVGLLLAVIGGSAGAWNAQITAITIVWLIAILGFGYLILDPSRTPSAKLNEFRRYLQWLKSDMSAA